MGATPTIHLVIGLLTKDPEANTSPSATLLNKEPKAVPVTQGQDRIYVCLSFW